MHKIHERNDNIIIEINQIYNMDCLIGMKNMPDNSIDLVVTDPPYKVTSRGNPGNTGGMLKNTIFMQGKVFKYNNVKPIEYIPEFYRLLKDGSHCYIMTNHINLQEMLNVATKSNFKFVKSLIWNKGNKIMGHYYMSQFEYILLFRKGKGKKINKCGTADILNIPNKKTKNENKKNLHDTEKPIELMQILVENSSQENEIVLDPFMGIGTTAIACINTNRKYIGFELDTTYCSIAQQRILNIVCQTQ